MAAQTLAARADAGVTFPSDPGLAEVPALLEMDWVWQAYCREFGTPVLQPARIRVHQFVHSLGRAAIGSYEIEWPEDQSEPSILFGIVVQEEGPLAIFRYPDDRRLPGLSAAAHPDSALRLLNDRVLAVRERRSRVELIRYRPASRAVLRHKAGRTRFYARVMRPENVAPLLAAHEMIAKSSFVSPRLAGHWVDGGVVWLSEIPGKNLREQIRRGHGPDPMTLLDGLKSIWRIPQETRGASQFNLPGAYARARQSLKHYTRDHDVARRYLADAAKTLDPFVRSWTPTTLAHNDFYDDQMLQLEDGRVALVDFEEAGPGDPMLDVGNFLAHLKWAQNFGRAGIKSGNGEYYTQFRATSIDVMGWNPGELALREAACLFRICTNTIRRPRADWPVRLEAGLALVNETLR